MPAMRKAAIVVGLCAHGLDMVRALALNGITVHALESKANIPGTSTCLATVHLVDDISGPGLIPSVLSLLEGALSGNVPVLLLTNDRMVFEVAANWEKLAGKVKLSWAGCREQAPRFLLKEHLPEICARANLKYPRSIVANSRTDPGVAALESFAFPVMVKPVRPMASFKAVLLENREDLGRHFQRYEADLPFVIQEWIPGDVTSLKFCALYLDRGRPVAHFEGRKLDTLPRGLGTTTAAERIEAPGLYEATLRFFDGYGLSGPVSLEFKEDASGNLWVIEPTVFRTDYWAGCCVVNGVNLPLIEYLHQADLPIQAAAPTTKSRVWVDLERNPLSLFSAIRARPSLLLMPWRLSLTYLSPRDLRPFRNLLGQFAARLAAKLRRRAHLATSS